MVRLFKNSRNQVRSGWKIVILLLTYEIVSFVVLSIYESILGLVFASRIKGNVDYQQIIYLVIDYLNSNPLGSIITYGLDFICLILTVYLVLKLIDKKRFRDIGFFVSSKSGMQLITGLLFGAASMTLLFIILLVTGNISLLNSITNPQFSISTASGILVFIFVGIKEEVLSRGYCITALNQMERPWLSVIISSAIFSLLHIMNPGVSPLGLLNIFLVGILFGLMYLKSSSLWMPIGYHITWNYFQGDIFGLPVSGLPQKGIYSIDVYMDNLLTGGSFGPEAGLLATAIIVLGIMIIWKFYKRGAEPL